MDTTILTLAYLWFIERSYLYYVYDVCIRLFDSPHTDPWFDRIPPILNAYALLTALPSHHYIFGLYVASIFFRRVSAHGAPHTANWTEVCVYFLAQFIFVVVNQDHASPIEEYVRDEDPHARFILRSLYQILCVWGIYFSGKEQFRETKTEAKTE